MWFGGHLKSFCFTSMAAWANSKDFCPRKPQSAGFLNLAMVSKTAGCRLTREMNWFVTVVTCAILRAVAASWRALQVETTEDCH